MPSLVRWSYIRHGEETDRHRHRISGFERSRRSRSHHGIPSLCSYLAWFCFLHKRRFATSSTEPSVVHVCTIISPNTSHSSHRCQLPPSVHKGLPTSAPLAHQQYQHPASKPIPCCSVLSCSAPCRNSLRVLLMSFEEAHNGST